MNHCYRSIFAASLTATPLVPSLHAQITHTATALATMTCSALSSTDQIPAGTLLSPTATMLATSSWGSANCSYQTSTPSAGPRYSVSETSTVTSTGPALVSISTGPNESIWTLQASQPVQGLLTLSGTSATTSILATTIVTVDIGNDGSIEWNLATSGPTQIPVTITGSLTIKVATETLALAGQASATVDLQFSVTGSRELYGSGCGSPQPLALDSNAPRTGATWVLTTNNVDLTSPFAVTFFGQRGPALPLTSFGFNAPGCQLHLSTFINNTTTPNLSGGTWATVVIPSTPSLAGVRLAAQSACLTTANPANLLTSNGVEGTIGT